jgi:hypothetical protein
LLLHSPRLGYAFYRLVELGLKKPWTKEMWHGVAIHKSEEDGTLCMPQQWVIAARFPKTAMALLLSFRTLGF